KKVQEHVTDAIAKGATVEVGGKPASQGGLFFEPTILTGATGDMRLSREETFGPIAPLFKFSTEEQVIEMANNTKFGLASYFYSRDISKIFRVAEALECGMVGVNTGLIS
ncbi:aldehyde dehydrogenase family protein, partial [Mesorhizobium sp. M4B.F.Ca.ET.190.01.1.1]